MYSLYRLAVMIATLTVVAAEDDLFMMSRRTPRYFQANMTFARAKQYFQQNLPYSDFDNITPKNVGFAVLCGVAGRLVEASIVNPRQSNPQALIMQQAAYARQNYKEVASAMSNLLEEASSKVAPIINLMNSLCTPTSFFDCNGRMDARVLSDPYALRLPAKLFIHLGKLSKNILRNQILIERLVNNNEVVPYLSQHVTGDSIDKLIKKMARTYTIMKMMGTVF